MQGTKYAVVSPLRKLAYHWHEFRLRETRDKYKILGGRLGNRPFGSARMYGAEEKENNLDHREIVKKERRWNQPRNISCAGRNLRSSITKLARYLRGGDMQGLLREG